MPSSMKLLVVCSTKCFAIPSGRYPTTPLRMLLGLCVFGGCGEQQQQHNLLLWQRQRQHGCSGGGCGCGATGIVTQFLLST